MYYSQFSKQHICRGFPCFQVPQGKLWAHTAPVYMVDCITGKESKPKGPTTSKQQTFPTSCSEKKFHNSDTVVTLTYLVTCRLSNRAAQFQGTDKLAFWSIQQEHADKLRACSGLPLLTPAYSFQLELPRVHGYGHLSPFLSYQQCLSWFRASLFMGEVYHSLPEVQGNSPGVFSLTCV